MHWEATELHVRCDGSLDQYDTSAEGEVTNLAYILQLVPIRLPIELDVSWRERTIKDNPAGFTWAGGYVIRQERLEKKMSRGYIKGVFGG